ncbi:MAG TPA: hypothetical protein VKQ72_23025, partial [Aggregatilineales bacterium]|nr:hypothetical protein [Aggregatilineales bacterium]
KLTSFNMAYVLTLSGSGMQGNDGNLSIKGNGPFQLDTDMASAMASGDTSALDKITFENTLTGSGTTKGQTTTFNADIRILNGILYFQSDKASAGQWKSISLASALQALASRRGQLGGLGGNSGGKSGGNPFQAAAVMSAGVKLLQTPGFISAQRAADTTLENQQIANFIFRFDVNKLFNSPDFITFVKTVASNNPTVSKMTDAQLQAIASQLATASQNTQFSITRLVGVTDKLPHGFSIDLSLNVDPTKLPRVAARLGTTSGANAQPVKLDFHFQVTITGIGTKATVTAPEGAQPINMGGAAATEAPTTSS